MIFDFFLDFLLPGNIDLEIDGKQHNYEDRKEHDKERVKKYQEANKERIREQQKQYRANNKEKLKEMFKQWREANLEYDSERKKQRL